MGLNLEKKFNASNVEAKGTQIEGYASVFGAADQQGDAVERGAFANSLNRREAIDIKMLWQHDPAKPIGVWTSICEDEYGLKVEGYIIEDVLAGKEALALLAVGAVKGLSIGYRTLQSAKNNTGGRILREVDLWEISLVTFPMLSEAQVNLKSNLSAQAVQSACQELIATIKEIRA